MKKISTAAAKQARIFPTETDHRIGSGDRNSWYCVLDEAGQIWSSGRTKRNIAEVFGAMPAVGSRWKSGRIRPGQPLC